MANEDRTCRVCFEKDAEICTLPCKHVVMCQQCYLIWQNGAAGGCECVYCRQRIQSIALVRRCEGHQYHVVRFDRHYTSVGYLNCHNCTLRVSGKGTVLLLHAVACSVNAAESTVHAHGCENMYISADALEQSGGCFRSFAFTGSIAKASSFQSAALAPFALADGVVLSSHLAVPNAATPIISGAFSMSVPRTWCGRARVPVV